MIKLPPAKARDTEIELQEKRKTNMNNRNRQYEQSEQAFLEKMEVQAQPTGLSLSEVLARRVKQEVRTFFLLFVWSS